jgi:hypothetical protein
MELIGSQEFKTAYEILVPFLAGRELFVERHALVPDVTRLKRALQSDSIEVSITRVNPGKVVEFVKDPGFERLTTTA